MISVTLECILADGRVHLQIILSDTAARFVDVVVVVVVVLSYSFMFVFLFIIVIWLCLTRTGNYQIHEFDGGNRIEREPGWQNGRLYIFSNRIILKPMY